MAINLNEKGPQTVLIPFVDSIDARANPLTTGVAGSDVVFQNVFFEPVITHETGQKEYHVLGREGYSQYIAPSTAALGKGIYYWRQTGKVYSVFGNKIYKDTTNLGVTLRGPVGNNLECSFAETRPGATTQYLGVTDGVDLYLIAQDDTVIVINNQAVTNVSVANPSVITAASHGLSTGNKVILRNITPTTTPDINNTIYTITKIDNNNFSIPVNVTAGGAVTGKIGSWPAINTGDLDYMDTYWFTQKPDGSIWNCNSDDPTTWPDDKFIFSQMQPGRGVGLARQNNVLIAFSDQHAQMFYDAANPAGSPNSNIEQAMQQIGCLHRSSIAHQENLVYWISNTRTGGYEIYQLDGTTSLTPIGIPQVLRDIQLSVANAGTTNISAFLMRVSGHTFYILQLTTINKTWVYDQTTKLWSTWGGTTAFANPSYWPIQQISQGTNNAGLNVIFCQHFNDGKIYQIKPGSGVFQDDNVSYTVVLQTNPMNFGTNRRKFYNRLDLLGDSISNETEVISVKYTDDDYRTFSLARDLLLSVVRRFGMNWGNSRRRAWSFSALPIKQFRLSGFELEIELGQ